MLKIKPTDRVLEIGSGNRPRKRSNVLCDKYVDDNTERAGQEDLVIKGRPLVVADGHALPFKDKSFDYVITSHILEHMADPHKFIAELTRVASAGFIETPSELGEKVFGWPFHRWRVRFEKDTIILRPWEGSSPFGDYFHTMYASDLFFAEFVDSHWGDFYVQYEWQNTIKLRIESDMDTKVKPNLGMGLINIKPERKVALVSIIRSAIGPFLTALRHFRKFE